MVALPGQGQDEDALCVCVCVHGQWETRPEGQEAIELVFFSLSINIMCLFTTMLITISSSTITHLAHTHTLGTHTGVVLYCVPAMHAKWSQACTQGDVAT